MRIPALVVAITLGTSAAAAPPKSATMPTLRSGERKLVEMPTPPQLSVKQHSIDMVDELIQLTVNDVRIDQVNAHSVGGAPIFAFSTGELVWLRRPAKDAGTAIEGELFVAEGSHSLQPSLHSRWKLPAPSKVGADATVRTNYWGDVGQMFSEGTGTPFYSFAYARAREMKEKAATSKARDRARPARPTRGGELERLMDTTTGMASIQEAIQADRPLWLSTVQEKATVALNSIAGPKLTSHPFDAMLKALKKPVPEEKLAAATPAEFYYLRLNDLSVFFRIVDQLDAWATPAMNVLESRGEDHAISERTLTQLGLERSQLARALGTQVIADLAIVGSDPYVREGSDVTVIFRVKQPSLFEVALQNALATHRKAHQGSSQNTVDHQGTAIVVIRSDDGAVRQHRATVGDLQIVSNSLAATKRVLDAIAGRTAKLSDEPDLRYMLARGNGTRSDAFLFLGDRFVGAVVGPRQKILEARRQLAAAELMTPGYAALLYGWMEGRAPVNTEALIASGWLKKEDLKHSDGAAIAFTPTLGARSRWGAPSALEPILDLPVPKLVTKSEADGYQRFADSYQNYWQQYLDPIAVRIGVEPDGKKGTRLTADVRVIPLIEGTSYRELGETVGRARLLTPTLTEGVRAVLGIGKDARLRREVSHMAGSTPLGKIELDWLGDWIFFGVEDRVETARTVLMLDEKNTVQAPIEDSPSARFDLGTLLQTPFYLAIGVRNAVGAALFLTAAKKMAADAAPGLIEWREGPPYKSTHTVHISIAGKSLKSDAPDANIWYAVTGDALVFTLSDGVLHRVIDERAGGKGTRAVEKQDDASQFVLDWASEPNAPLNRVIGWLFEAIGLEGLRTSRSRAEAFLRGAPGVDLRTIALTYEGAEPLPPDGGHYAMAPDGVRDPSRGSAIVPRWPAVPVKDSPVDRLTRALASFRGEIGFDDEPAVNGQPPMRSLHAKVTLGLRP